MVDTNIYHIARTFDSTADKRYSKELNFLKTLWELNDTVKIKKESTGKEEVLFSPCWNILEQYNKPDFSSGTKQDYSARIEYEFQDTSDSINDNFTIMYYDEYEYIVDYINKINREALATKKEGGKSKQKNLIDILNLYCYLKYLIALSISLNHTAHPTIKTLAEKLGLGKDTITKYINILVDMKVITYTKGDFTNKTSNTYLISKEWRKIDGESESDESEQ